MTTLVGAALALALVAPPAAAAEPLDNVGPPLDISGLDPYIEFVDATVEGAAEGTAYCYGRTGVPFKDGGYAKVRGKTACSVTQRYIYVHTDLYRHRWYGWQFLDGRTADCTWCKVRRVTPAWNCSGAGTYTYLGVSQHHIITREWAELSGQTANENRFTC